MEELDLADPAPGVETNTLAREMLSLVTDFPEAERDAVFPVYVEGYSNAEAEAIAAALERDPALA